MWHLTLSLVGHLVHEVRIHVLLLQLIHGTSIVQYAIHLFSLTKEGKEDSSSLWDAHNMSQPFLRVLWAHEYMLREPMGGLDFMRG